SRPGRAGPDAPGVHARRSGRRLLARGDARRDRGRRRRRLPRAGQVPTGPGRELSTAPPAGDEDAGDLAGGDAARPGAVKPDEGFRARAPGGLTGKGRARAGRRPRVPPRRRRVPDHEEPPGPRVIVLTCEDGYGVRDNQVVLLNRSGRTLEEL